MGCTSSKKTSHGFGDALNHLTTEVHRLHKQHKRLSRSLRRLPVAEPQPCRFAKVQSDFSSRVNKVESLISELSLQSTRKLLSSFHKAGDKPSADEPTGVPLAKAPVPIIEDPSIKALIESNRRRLQRNPSSKIRCQPGAAPCS